MYIEYFRMHLANLVCFVYSSHGFSQACLCLVQVHVPSRAESCRPRMHCRTWPGCDEFGLGEEGRRRDSRLWPWWLEHIGSRSRRSSHMEGFQMLSHEQMSSTSRIPCWILIGSWWILFAFLGPSWTLRGSFCIVRTDGWQQASSPGTKACQPHSQALWFGEEGNCRHPRNRRPEYNSHRESFLDFINLKSGYSRWFSEHSLKKTS